jgi:DNA-binding NtrC family response regulator
MSKERVLLVDDEKEFVEALSERMANRGVQVDAASDGLEALNKVKGKSYDAVILDLAMPGMDGIETLRRLLEMNPDLQIILLTGHASVEKGIEACKLGALDFLEKPAKLDVLLEKIKEAQTNRIMLVEKRSEERIKKLIGSKGW